MITFPGIIIHIPDNGFLSPYLRHEFSDCGESDNDIVSAVMVSSTDVYDVSEGENIDENTATIPAHRFIKEENEFIDFCNKKNLEPTILRCPHIVGTGMGGMMRRLVNGIYRGTYMHIKHNEARQSVIHAVDVASTARSIKGHTGIFNISDGSHPSIHDLAEAFAVRLDNKRISDISPRWARLWYGKDYYESLTRTLTFSSRIYEVLPTFRPNIVTDYLRTHIYDENSL